MEPMETSDEPLQPTGLENEFKTVPGVQAPEPVYEAVPDEMRNEPAPREDEDVFFGDAPDQRTKKVGYN